MNPPRWLVDRLDDTPPGLRERLQEVVQRLPEGPVIDSLLEAACSTLEAVRGRIDLRESAFELLLADGLLTLACEAAAHEEPDRLVEVCRVMGPAGRLGELTTGWGSRR